MTNRPHKVYEYIAFITGFALLSFELVASRLLAPTIGSSTYVWTSVIGVIIAALALGYSYGGKLADRRVAPIDVGWMLIASAGGIAATMIMAPYFLHVLGKAQIDQRLLGMLASTVLFAPVSFVLGAISPYLGRLKNVSVNTTGTTIASLGALNSVGGIVGTFATGFLFFAYMGSKQTLILLVMLLIITSWLIEPSRQGNRRMTVSLIIIVLATIGLGIKAPGAVATIDTPSATYRIRDVDYRGKTVRAISVGPGGIQSGVYKDGSKELVFDYTRKLAEIVEASPTKERILILGGGGYTLPQYLGDKYPNSRIDVVEIDPELAEISRQYLNYRDPKNVYIIEQDARTFLNRKTDQYDIVLGDVFNDDLIPFSLTTAEYVDRLEKAVAPDGIVAVNVIGSKRGACGELLAAMHRTYGLRFSSARVYPLEDMSIEKQQNVIFLYGQSEDALANYPDSQVSFEDAQVFSDDFAPVEHLQSQC